MKTNSSGRRWTLAAGVTVLIGVALAGPAFGTDATTAFAKQAVSPMRITAPSRATVDDPVPTRSYSGPAMLVDPDNPKVILASSVEERSGICYLMRSSDGGVHWTTLPALPALNAYPKCFTVNGGVTQTPMAWGRNHTLYYGLLGYDARDGGAGRSGNISVQLARSSDLGNSFSTTLVENARGKTGTAVENNSPMASIAVDPKTAAKDIVYVGYRQEHPNIHKSPNLAVVSASTDGGQTFGPPVDLSKFISVKITDSAGKVFPASLNTPQLAVNGDTGALYVVSTVSAPFGAGAKNPPPQPMELFTSTDHGQTFSAHPFTPADPSLGLENAAWSPIGGPQGTLLVAYQGKFGQTQGSTDIFVQRSTDGGATFSPPVRVNDDDPARLTEHFLPNMAVAGDGRVDVAWYDFRNSRQFGADVYYTYSTDGGATWAPNVRATDQLINFNIGLNANFDVRQPPGIGSADQYTTIGWDDTRLGDPRTQTQDVFTSVAQYTPVASTGGSKVLRYLAAIFVGLALAGLIILILALSRRRAGEAPPTSPGPRTREPVGAS